MKTQQAVEREEQQKIKNLVLNYDLREGEDQDGDSALRPLLPNPNIHKQNAGLEKPAGLNHARPDKSVNNRSGQRARKLQLSDVDWYEPKQRFSIVETELPLPFVKRDGSNGARVKRAVPVSPTPLSLAAQQRLGRPVRATKQGQRLTRHDILQ